MLSSRARLEARQGKYGTPRHEYLQQLVSEFQRTPHHLRREEILANLANFAYDPINYGALRELRIMELFVDCIANSMIAADGCSSVRDAVKVARRGMLAADSAAASDRTVFSQLLLREFALGGIANCIPDPALQSSFLDADGTAHALSITLSITPARFADPEVCEQDERERCELNAALSALSICYFLLDSPAILEVSTEAVVGHMNELTSHPNTQIANLAGAFLLRFQELIASDDLSNDSNLTRT
ncbi:hypothetical protein PINS_up013210 [Pythium insidiosum]|nr:hypothetical protein PINS_up013210 [Pythium insidiosum]